MAELRRCGGRFSDHFLIIMMHAVPLLAGARTGPGSVKGLPLSGATPAQDHVLEGVFSDFAITRQPWRGMVAQP
jgi:hypothetical protein